MLRVRLSEVGDPHTAALLRDLFVNPLIIKSSVHLSSTMSRAIQSAGAHALSPLLLVRVLQPRAPRHITNHLLCCQRVPHLEDHRRPNSTRASDKQDLSHRPAPLDLWERIPSSIIARGHVIDTSNDLQKWLNEDGHRVWGFVIYRCTYGDDAAWEECLRRLTLATRLSMHYYEALYLLDDKKDYRFVQTVFQDAAKFDGASTQVVRRHF
jgi:hypothetical protein